MAEMQHESDDCSGRVLIPNSSYSVDDKDLALVRLLRSDARKPYSELGSAVSLSADAVRIRIDRLIQEGYIRLVTLVDPSLVGKTSRVSIGLITSGPPEVFAAWARAQAEVIHMVRTLGTFSFFGEFVSESDITSHRFITEKLQNAPGVVAVEAWPMLQINKWREDTRAPSVEKEILDKVSWTDDDRELLQTLAQSPRIQFRELAEKLGRPYSVVRRRTMTLLEAGVVRSTIVTDELLVDHSHLAILLVKGDARAREVLKARKEVTILHSSSGSRQFLGEVRADSGAGLALLGQELRLPDNGVAEVELLMQVAVDKLPASFQF